jgi:single-strand DNA-binding protein
VACDKLAENCNTYLKKGMSCLVDGRLSIRSYETKEGEKRKAAEVVVNTMQMLDRANRAGGDGGSYERPRAAAAAPANGTGGGGYDDALDEEEIPF